MKGEPVIAPVYMTATYKFENSDDLIDVVQNRNGYIYSRWDNPSVAAVEAELAELEGYPSAVGFGSGMAAITTAIMANIKAGDRVVGMQEVYGGTYELLNDVLPSFNIETTLVNCWDQERLSAEIDKGVSILYLETPTNPLLRVIDIEPLAEAAHARGAIVLLDSTFASPVNQRPVDLGVDVVIHSGTKYLGGHHDVTAGFACGVEPYIHKIWDYRKILGGVMDPMTAFLTLRGLRTLDLRIEKHNENAMRIARFLESRDEIKTVHYPGLPSHPDHEIAVKQMSGFGGMLSFEGSGDFDRTRRFMERLEKIKRGTSLGG
ncbi:MAG: aminotransferase class I/II-fold pyridoxal phosphate-dependent enzyme, partial [Desulfobacterales bacterium]|nr:aminotransferase class I/II-fold pyridoxal phosphate-dependent enzyme [Desulfobacterales bacterium]